MTVSDFLLARQMVHTVAHWKRKLLVVTSLCINLGLLCYFKYTNFFYEMLCPLWNGHFEALDIFLPVGISFFTFQSLSYTLDVYRGDLKPLSSLLDYAFYVSFFPQLVAGPIVRARDFVPQIRQPLTVTNEMFGQGIFFIVSGLFKKAVISDFTSALTSWNVSSIIRGFIRALKTCLEYMVMPCRSIVISPGFIRALKTCLEYMVMPCRFIVISPDIAIWLSGLLCCWVSVSR